VTPDPTERADLPEPLIELEQISEEFGNLVERLARLSENEIDRQRGQRRSVQVTSDYIRAIIRARRLRDSYFKGGLFADPAWDMLLDLLAAHLDRNRVAVSSLCIAAAVPPTTALRYIKTMTDKGVLLRDIDPYDPRRVYIRLSDSAAKALCAYFAAARGIVEHPL